MILRRALLRLTILTTVVILASIAIFAFAVDRYVAFAFDLELPADSEQSLNATLATLRAGLAIGFALMAVLTPFVSFFLARRSLAPVRTSMEGQQRFIDDAAHEFRTPIAVAQGELELALLQDRTPDEYRQASETALGALADLGALTDALLLLTRGGDFVDGASEQVSGEDVARRAIEAMPAEVRGRIRLQLSGSGMISGHPGLLVRALANLLENSAKYADSDSEILLRVGREGGVVRFAVEDHGPGLSVQDTDRAFDRFWRGPDARAVPGNGIGLSIVRRIAESHGGRVVLRSEPGRGTTAAVDVPVAR